MSFSKLTFPLTIDCTTTEYWIGEEGPFAFGAATTELFCGGINSDDRETLMEELERCLQAFGGHLNAYIQPPQVTKEAFEQVLDTSAATAISYRYRVRPGEITFLRGMTFSTLRDFLYTDLCHAILIGNGPRQCRLCGRWFLHENGDRAMYCGRVAPGETEKTCREMGARMVFEKKIQDEEPWKLYKRAYKKYYARLMKGAMSKEDFRAWADRAMEARDAALRELEGKEDAEWKAQRIEALRVELNRA